MRAFLVCFACASAVACSGKAQSTGGDTTPETVGISDAGGDSHATSDAATDSPVSTEAGLPPCTFDNSNFDNCVFSQ
jgi:hypothetical protein